LSLCIAGTDVRATHARAEDKISGTRDLVPRMSWIVTDGMDDMALRSVIEIRLPG